MNNLASNLFNSNLNLTNNDITSHKRKFKNYKNTLAEFTSRKVNKKVKIFFISIGNLLGKKIIQKMLDRQHSIHDYNEPCFRRLT